MAAMEEIRELKRQKNAVLLSHFYTSFSDAVAPAMASIKSTLRNLMLEKVGIERAQVNLPGHKREHKGLYVVQERVLA